MQQKLESEAVELADNFSLDDLKNLTQMKAGISMRYVNQFQDIPVCGSEFFKIADEPQNLRDLIDLPMVSMPEGTSTRNFYNTFLIRII